MGRRSRSQTLVVWANGLLVGRWLMPASGPTEFSYDPSWVASKQARPISLSLPINLDGLPIKDERVGFFFDNLLPDTEAVRQRIRDRFHTSSADAFDLLQAIGRDCVGAIQLLPEGTQPEGTTKISATPLDASEVEKMLRRAVSAPSTQLDDDDDDDFRISIAGAQEKTALTWHDGRWCRPHGATPTTHIFKLPLGLVGGGRQYDMRASLENEWLCSRLLAGFGLPIAESRVEKFGSTKALIVTRFDRALHSSKRYWLRLPQEDFCQATGTPSSRKYESEGGPGLIEIARVLQGSESREEDLALLLRAQLLFWMLAATDGHAKNFSLRLLAEGRYRLTPLYDVISAWPIAGPRDNQIHPKKLKLAMAMRGKNKHYRLVDIRRPHFDETAQLCGLGSDMGALIDDIVDRMPAVIESVGAALPREFPETLFTSVTAGLKKTAKEIGRSR